MFGRYNAVTYLLVLAHDTVSLVTMTCSLVILLLIFSENRNYFTPEDDENLRNVHRIEITGKIFKYFSVSVNKKRNLKNFH